MRVLRTLMPRKTRHPVSYKLKRACGAIKSFLSFLFEFSISVEDLFACSRVEFVR